MKALDALNITNYLAASQKGLFTSAQAQLMGVGRMELSRLTVNGHLERVSRGIYRAAGAPSLREETVWAVWLSMDPAIMAYDRNPFDCTVSHNTAAWLMNLGEVEPEPITFTCASRRQVAARGIRVIKANMEVDDIATVSGLPCTTAARTIIDLLISGEDISLVAAILLNALERNLVPDVEGLRKRVDALGPRRGLCRSDSLWDLMLKGDLDGKTVSDCSQIRPGT